MTVGPAGHDDVDPVVIDPVIGGSSALAVAAASGLAALSGFAVQAVVARSLPPAVNADFLLFWSLLFIGYGLISGLQQEATRGVGSVRLDPGRRRAAMMPVALGVGAMVAALLAVTARWWRPVMLAGQPVLVVVALCVSVALYAGHLATIGTLAGRQHWSASAVVMSAEAMVRLGAVLMVARFRPATVGFEIAVALAAAVWLVLLPWPTVARVVRARSDGTVSELVRQSLQVIAASAGWAVLVVGFPLLMRLTSDARSWAAAAPLLLAISWTRAPLMMPLSAFQGVVVSYFLDPRRSAVAGLARLLAVIAAVGLLGIVLAGLVGPALMAWLVGPAYRLPGGVLAGLTLAAVILAAVTAVGAVVLALGRHRAYALGWALAAVVGVAALFSGGTLTQRSMLALIVGPLAGLAVHVAAVLRAERQRSVLQPSSSPSK